MLIRKKYRISITYLSLACLSIFFLLPQITGSTELNKTAKAHLKLAEIALENSNFDEVIKRANKHDCGLAGYVCTNSMEKAFKASEQLETGVVAVNTPVVATAETPFGGIKQTGYGREGGSVGIKDYLNIKYTHLGLSG